MTTRETTHLIFAWIAGAIVGIAILFTAPLLSTQEWLVIPGGLFTILIVFVMLEFFQ